MSEAGAGVRHATVVVERRLSASLSRVFRAFTNAAERRRWDVPGQGWTVGEHVQDFRVGGREWKTFGPPGDPYLASEGSFLAIAESRHIISAGVMHEHGRPMTATLATVELRPDGAGTRVVLTDQSAYFGEERPEYRQVGWGEILDRLATHLEGD